MTTYNDYSILGSKFGSPYLGTLRDGVPLFSFPRARSRVLGPQKHAAEWSDSEETQRSEAGSSAFKGAILGCC